MQDAVEARVRLLQLLLDHTLKVKKLHNDKLKALSS